MSRVRTLVPLASAFLISVAIGWAGCRIQENRIQDRLRRKIEEAGGRVEVENEVVGLDASLWGHVRALLEKRRFRAVVLLTNLSGDEVIAAAVRLRPSGLYLSGDWITDEDLQPLAAAKDLETLSLGDSSATPTGLGKLLEQMKVRELFLQGSDANFKVVASAQRVPTLETLSISDAELTPELFNAMAGIGSLRRIVLRSCRWPSDADFTTIQPFPQSISLGVGNMHLPLQIGQLLGKIKKLTKIQVGTSELPPQFYQALGDSTQLASVEIVRCQTTDEDIALLSANSSIETLVICSPLLTDHLSSHLSRMKQLRSLGICGDAEITDKSVPALGSLPNLTWLGVPAGVTPQGLGELERKLPSCKIISDY